MSSHFSGSCGCGTINFEVKALRTNVVNCHCNSCRKMNGGSFSTYFVVSQKNFELTAGEDFLSCFSLTENARKHFCKICGTPVFNLNLKYPRLRMVHFGTLNLPAETTPDVNIFCQSKLPWVAFDCEMMNFKQEIEK